MNETGNKKNILRDKSFAFAVRIAKLYRYLIENKKEFVLSKQLLRSGTAIGANIREAYNAESKKDFLHKLAIAQKECDESLYWLGCSMQSNVFLKKNLNHYQPTVLNY